MDKVLVGHEHSGGTEATWAGHGSLWDPLADEAPAFVLLQLCPVIEAAFEDMHEELLRLVKGECTALSHLFSFLLSQPPGCGSGGGTSPVWPEQPVGRAPVDPCLGGADRNSQF